MATFTGTTANETITETVVSPTVSVVTRPGGPVRPSAEADIIDAGGGNDNVAGGGGNDVFIWNPGDGRDVVNGGTGFDSLAFTGSGAPELFEISDDGSRVRLFRDAGNIVMDLGGIERIRLVALGGNDRIDARALIANAVVLDIDGGTGNDTIYGGARDDTIRGGTGNDSLTGGGGNDLFGWASGDGSDTVDGQAGFDTLGFRGADVAETFDISNQGTRVELLRNVGAVDMDLGSIERIEFDALGGNDLVDGRGLVGNSVVLDVDGGAGKDTIFGGAGADTLSGGTGSDSMAGGGGGDVFRWAAGDGSDTVNGQAGVDTLDFRGADIGEVFGISDRGTHVELSRDVGAVDMDLKSVERIDVDAGGGDDLVDGRQLVANPVVLDIDGGAGDDTIFGGANADTLSGSAGDDSLVGGDGNDVMTGGGGADDFLVENDPGNDSDWISDYSWRSGDDSLTLDGYSVAQYDNATVTNTFTSLGNPLIAEATIRVGGDTILLIDGAGQGFISGSDLRSLDLDLGDFFNIL